MPDPIPNLEEIQALDRAHVIHPISEFSKHEKRGAQIFVGGHGVELQLADGRTLIDGFSGLFNINVGHGRREIADAVAAQMRELAYYPSFWDFGNGFHAFGPLGDSSYADDGVFQGTLTVTDNDGLTDTATFTVVAGDFNHAPEILSTPIPTAREGIQYVYQVV